MCPRPKTTGNSNMSLSNKLTITCFNTAYSTSCRSIICQVLNPQMIHCQISKETLSLYFWLDVFCIFEARAPKIEVLCTSTAAPVSQLEGFRA
jgi:hypothetical protein